MERSYSFNVLVKLFRNRDVGSLTFPSGCKVVTYIRCPDNYLELWVSCISEEAVVDLVRHVFNELGPIIVVGFLNGSVVELPTFLSNVSRALAYVTLSGQVELECVTNSCLSVDVKQLNASKVMWNKSVPNRLKCVVKDLPTSTTFTAGLRVVKPYVIPPKLVNLPVKTMR